MKNVVIKIQNLKKAIARAGKGLWEAFPMILGTILLISLISILIPKSFYTTIFYFGWQYIVILLVVMIFTSVLQGMLINKLMEVKKWD